MNAEMPPTPAPAPDTPPVSVAPTGHENITPPAERIKPVRLLRQVGSEILSRVEVTNPFNRVAALAQGLRGLYESKWHSESSGTDSSLDIGGNEESNGPVLVHPDRESSPEPLPEVATETEQPSHNRNPADARIPTDANGFQMLVREGRVAMYALDSSRLDRLNSAPLTPLFSAQPRPRPTPSFGEDFPRPNDRQRPLPRRGDAERTLEDMSPTEARQAAVRQIRAENARANNTRGVRPPVRGGDRRDRSMSPNRVARREWGRGAPRPLTREEMQKMGIGF